MISHRQKILYFNLAENIEDRIDNKIIIDL